MTEYYEGLCIESGGVKGLDMLGTLHIANSLKKINSVSVYSGSSVGSIICYLHCIGYEPIEIFTSACEPKFNSFFEHVNFMNIKNKLGLYPNSILREKLEEMTMLKMGYIPTFNDIKQKMGKTVIITAYKLGSGERKVYFDYQNFPDMKVIDAVILSCSIPFIFERAKYKNETYIDGAYTCQFPIKVLEERCEGKILGIKMKDKEESADNLFDYIKTIMMIPLFLQKNEKTKNSTDIIEITEGKGKSTFNFNLSTKDKIEAFNNGIKHGKEFYKVE